MAPILLLFSVFLLLSVSSTHSSPLGNITVVGTVFCDACSENNFSKHSYFLRGVKVQIVCKFSLNTSGREEISINTERITDKFGVYKLDVPSVDGFECREGRALDSLCKASLMQSPASLCNIPSLSSSTEHLAFKSGEFKTCVYDLNALSYRPAQRDDAICGKREEVASLDSVQPTPSSLNSALFFWPPFLPCPFWPPLHFPNPPSLPFPFPFPFPLPFPFPNQQPSLPYPFPPIPFFSSPPPASLSPFLPLPYLAPPPSSIFSFPFPFPFPPFPSFNPAPSGYPQPTTPLPRSPPQQAFPVPFIPMPPFFPFPRSPSPPAPALPLSDPRKQNQP